jgi:hypothetical protein
MLYYHVSRRELRLNTILTTGVYGERIRRPDFVENHYATHLKEEIFEAIRKSEYPNRPSRTTSAFLWQDLATAQAFYANQGRYQHYLYAVEVLEGEVFRAEMDLLHCEGMAYERIAACARHYWQQIHHPNSQTIEVLLDGKAAVKKLILAPSSIWDF